MTEEQKEVRSRWRFTLVLTAALAGVIVIVMLIRPALQPNRHPRARSTCKTNLRQIGLACHMWADDHDEKFPDSLAQLVPNYVDNPKIFSCPLAPSQWQDFKGGLVSEESSSYTYLPGRNANFSGDFFLAYDRSADAHGGAGFNVVYCDAHTEWWRSSRRDDFNKLLDAQEKVVKAVNSDSKSPDDYSDDYEEAMRKYREIQRKVEGREDE